MISFFSTQPGAALAGNITVNQQAAVKSYGPKNASTFRLDSVHSSDDAIVRCFSITDGNVSIQDVIKENPIPAGHQNFDLVNVIVKTGDIPGSDLPVAYIVYKGIKRSSLFIGSEFNSSSNSLPDSLLKRIEEGADPASYPACIEPSQLGFGLGQDNDPLESLFSGNFINIPVKAGNHLGDFCKDRFAIQIMLHAPFVGHTLRDVRLFSNEFIVDDQSVSYSRLDREKVLAYMDPAAFYGYLGFAPAQKAYAVPVVSLTGNNLYQSYISTVFSLNKNNVYLDIRNDIDLSYSYFFDTSSPARVARINKFSIGNPGARLPLQEYNTSGWPIAILTPQTAASFKAALADTTLDLDLTGYESIKILTVHNRKSKDSDQKDHLNTSAPAATPPNSGTGE